MSEFPEGEKDQLCGREQMIRAVKDLFDSNPVFIDKLQYPNLDKSRLTTVISQSLNCPRNIGRNRNQALIDLLHVHSCVPIAFNTSPVREPLTQELPKAGGFRPMVTAGPIGPAPSNYPFPRKLLASLLLQCLMEEGFKKSVHMLEKESRFFFNMEYFEQCIRDGEWEEVHSYLSSFMRPEDEDFSAPIFFEIRKQRDREYLERENNQLSSRDQMLVAVKDLFDSNPVFLNKFRYPKLDKSNLRTIINHSLNCPHNIGRNPKQVLDIGSLFHDHSCRPIASVTSPVCKPLTHVLPKASGFRPMVTAGPIGPAPSNYASSLKRSALTSNPAADFQIEGTEQMLKKSRTSGGLDEIRGDQRVADELKKFKSCKTTYISKPSQLHSLLLPDSYPPSRIGSLIYSSTGEIVALDNNGFHRFWKWKDKQNLYLKATTRVPPELLQTEVNSQIHTLSEDPSPSCLAVSNEEFYLISSFERRTSIFSFSDSIRRMNFLKSSSSASATNIVAFTVMRHHFIAIGMDDGTIHIYTHISGKVNSKIEGHHIIRDHHEGVTGLAFSTRMNFLVSAGADSELMVWKLDRWRLHAKEVVKSDPTLLSKCPGYTRIRFHSDQTHLLVIRRSELALYETSKLEFLQKWVPPTTSMGLISDAVYSCDSQSVYAAFEHGSVCIFTMPMFELRCVIYPSSYLPSRPRAVYPVTITAHPSDSSQFAIGLSDGGVLVVEPPESMEEWGSLTVQSAGPRSSTSRLCD